MSMLKDPLVHFLAAGLALFALFALTASEAADEGDDSRAITVDREALLTFVQYRSRAFDPELAQSRLEALPEPELQLLIDDYVREEALHREALALGLDAHDYVIRRRLVQSVEFINQGLVQASSELDEGDIERYFERQIQDYMVAPSITFTHVFFDAERRGIEEARAAAEPKLAELNREGVHFSDAAAHTDRFPYHLNYVERTRDFVASHFGPEMTADLFQLEASEQTWYGPLESPYGVHLVMATSIESGRRPGLEEIRGRVVEDARQASVREATDAAVQAIIDSYDVRIEYRSDDGPEVAAQ